MGRYGLRTEGDREGGREGEKGEGKAAGCFGELKNM